MIAYCRFVGSMVFAGLLAGFVGCRTSENEYVPPPPAEVTVAQPVQQTVTPFLEKNGETEAVEQAEVRARVTGFVEEIKFEPGQDVAKDDVLYQIETDQYDAAVSSATAEVAVADAAIGVAEAMVKTAESEIKKAALDLKREEELMRKGAGAQSQLDAATAADAAAKAALDSANASVVAAKAQKGIAEASLAKAQLDLNYTTVHALISGKISKTVVKIGNLVENSSSLASIDNSERIFANFSISDRELLHYLKSEREVLERGEELQETEWRKIPVYLKRETDVGFPFEGKLNYVDSEGIDPKTGTLGLRAIFDNPAEQLLPGMFVTVRIPTGEPAEELLIPEYALARDQRGLYVLTVNAENKVERTELRVGKSISGWSVVKSGLAKESRVIIEGLQRAQVGLEVTPIEQKLTVDQQTLLRGISPTGRLDDEDSSSAESPEQE